jgi:CubicO group peptidase (beta-lactamase class C family)
MSYGRRNDNERDGLLPRILSRRAALRAAAGAVVATTVASGFAQKRVLAQDATPPATPQPGEIPDLTGVTPRPLTGDRLADFEAYVASGLVETTIPGAAVAVVQDGEVVLLKGFGVRELGQPAPVTADTLLRIGSVTKSFSSLLTAILVDAGRLSWETPLLELLPTFAVADPALTSRLTVRDAFCACTGLPRRDLEYQLRARELTPELMIDGMARLPLTAPYGEKFQYNNQLVAAGGFAASVADGGSPADLGRDYAIALRDRVLNPIGMARSTLSLSEVVAGNDYAVPHARDISGALHPMPVLEDDSWIVPVAPTGALWSSAREMARYVQTELNRGLSPDGIRVVSAENLERTWQPSVAIPTGSGAAPEIAAIFGHYGLGWFVGSYGGQRLIWHSGATLGFSSLVTFLPEANLGVVILTNGSGAADVLNYAVTFRLLELLFDQPAAFGAVFTTFLTAEREQHAERASQLGDVDPVAVAPFLGRYANADLGELTLALQAGTLLLTVGGFRSVLRPRLDTEAPATAYLPVDSPFGSGLSPMTVGLEPGAGGQPRVTLTIHDDDGKDLVYPFELVEAAA